MKTSRKIEIIDLIIAELKKGVKSERHSGICSAISCIGLDWVEEYEFEKFFQRNRPTLKNKWKNYADKTRPQTAAWWWTMYDVNPRVKFLQALKESLIKK